MPSPAGWRGKKALSSGVAEICLENLNSGDRINSYWCELVNHDGFDDMLICYSQRVTDGTFYYSGPAVLTRTDATDCLHTLPADF
jgi:hypothetical protein